MSETFDENEYLFDEAVRVVTDFIEDLGASKSLSSAISLVQAVKDINSINNNDQYPDDIKDLVTKAILLEALAGGVLPTDLPALVAAAWEIAQGVPDNLADPDKLKEDFFEELNKDCGDCFPLDENGKLDLPTITPDYVAPPIIAPEKVSPVNTDNPELNRPSDTELLEAFDNTKQTSSPIVLDLDGNGIDLAAVDSNGAVYWDIDNDGFEEASGWIAGNDGLLAIDLNGDGIINDHSELFGTDTTDGFTILSAYDSNSDNLINASDADFNNLIVWVDTNADGYSDSDELHTLSDIGITSINLNASLVDYEIAGNHITHESTFTINGQTQTIVDAWFTYDNMNSIYAGDYTFDARVLDLPTLRGFGDIPDLFIAMSMDETLLNMVKDVAYADTATLYSADFNILEKLQNIMYRWAGVDDVDPASRGSYIDARQLEFLEAYLGDDYLQRGANLNPGYSPAQQLELIFSKVFTHVLSGILVQSNSSFISDAAEYDLETGEFNNMDDIDNLWLTGTDSNTQATDDNDVYVLHDGTGSLFVNEDLDAGFDQVWVDALYEDVGIWGDNGEDLHIQIIATGDKLEINGVGSSGTDIVSRLEKIVFSDGFTLDVTQGLTMKDTNDAHNSYGSALDDFIDGRGGNDKLYGYAGNDTLIGGSGEDRLYGGLGDDIYFFEAGFGLGQGSLSDFANENIDEGLDTIEFSGGILPSNVYSWVDNGGDLHFRVGDASNDEVEFNGSYNSTNGTDIHTRLERVVFDDGTVWDLTQGLNLVDTNDGHRSYGSVLNDVIDGRGGNDKLYGYAGNDTLIGGSGSDYLYGGNDDDVLYGGSGSDYLYGESGSDTFVFDDISGSDNVQDFNLSENDKLDISDLLIGYDPLSDAITDFVQITDNGFSTIVSVDTDGGADNFTQVAYIYNRTGLSDEEALETSGNLIAA